MKTEFLKFINKFQCSKDSNLITRETKDIIFEDKRELFETNMKYFNTLMIVT